jgi:hypothetical protein
VGTAGRKAQERLASSEATEFLPVSNEAGQELLRKAAAADPTKKRLYFSANYDGDLDSYLENLANKAATGLYQIFSHCTDFPNTTPDNKDFKLRLKNYLKHHVHETDTFYSGYPGHSVDEVQTYISMHKRLNDFFNQAQFEPLLETMNLLPVPPPPAPKKPFLKIALPSLQPLLNSLFTPSIIHDTRTATSKQVDTKPDLTDWLYTVQNEMTVISAIDPAKLEALKRFLWVLNTAAKYVFTKGELGGIATIHFARWVIIDDGANLLFESNYDGNWEQYIGDFVDKASFGMDGVWSNCISYPKRGSKDLEAFKQIIIDNQVRAHVFYSAYRYSSVRNVINDIAISTKIADFINQPEVAGWLRSV